MGGVDKDAFKWHSFVAKDMDKFCLQLPFDKMGDSHEGCHLLD